MTEKKNRPAHEIRLGGVAAAIWKNTGDKGGTYHSVTPYRLYRDAQGNWKRSNSFDRDELLTLAKVLDQAHSWIYSQGHDQAPAAAEVPDEE